MQNLTDVILDKYIKEILQIVSDNSQINKSEIRTQLKSTSLKIVNSVNELIEAGLIREQRGLHYNTKHLSLTERGARVLKLINMIDSEETLEQLKEDDFVVSSDENIQNNIKG